MGYLFQLIEERRVRLFRQNVTRVLFFIFTLEWDLCNVSTKRTRRNPKTRQPTTNTEKVTTVVISVVSYNSKLETHPLAYTQVESSRVAVLTQKTDNTTLMMPFASEDAQPSTPKRTQCCKFCLLVTHQCLKHPLWTIHKSKLTHHALGDENDSVTQADRSRR
jgi:hypothetical protein